MEDEEDLPTAMELALRAAMDEHGVDLPTGRERRRSRGRGRRKKRGRRNYDSMQDEIVSRTLATHQARSAGHTHRTDRTGAVTLIQGFGSALNLNIHFHMLLLDGM